MAGQSKKTVVITGAGKGIGRETALLFLKNGWNTVAFSRTAADLDLLAAETGKFKGSLLKVTGDASIASDVSRLFSECHKVFGHADVVINNAGVFKSIPFLEMTQAFFEDQWQANTLSTFLVSRKFAGDMVQRKSGQIINIISVAAKRPFEGSAGYCSAKSAQEGLARVMREELKPFNVRVTNLFPGAAFTTSWKGTGVEEARLMKASDVAGVIFNVVCLDENMTIEDVVLRPVAGDL